MWKVVHWVLTPQCSSLSTFLHTKKLSPRRGRDLCETRI